MFPINYYRRNRLYDQELPQPLHQEPAFSDSEDPRSLLHKAGQAEAGLLLHYAVGLLS